MEDTEIERENKLLSTFCIVLAILCVLMFTWGLTGSLDMTMTRAEAISLGVARYNPTNSNFEFIQPQKLEK